MDYGPKASFSLSITVRILRCYDKRGYTYKFGAQEPGRTVFGSTARPDNAFVSQGNIRSNTEQSRREFEPQNKYDVLFNTDSDKNMKKNYK